AVTMMATLDVLQRAAASGHNLIITHEPTFYNHEDNPKELPAQEKDPVLAGQMESKWEWCMHSGGRSSRIRPTNTSFQCRKQHYDAWRNSWRTGSGSELYA